MKRLIIILLLCCMGCSPSRGAVVRKDFYPAHTWIWLMPMTMPCGKTTMTYFIPMPMYSPDAYSVTLQLGKHKGERFVGRMCWDMVQLGDTMSVDSLPCKRIPAVRQSERH